MANGFRLAATCTVLGFLVVPVRAEEGPIPTTDTDPAAQLPRLVEAYFEAPSERRQILRDIEKAAGGSVDAVAAAVRAMRPWTAPAEHQGILQLGATAGGAISASYLVPTDYDPSRAYPMLLCYRDKSMSTAETIALASHVLGSAISGFVLVCPHDSVGGLFHRPEPERADLPAVLRRIRVQIHIDGDRVFVFGYADGANAAWTAAIMHADALAGAVILSGVPQIPYPRQVYPVLLPNLRHLPVAAGWYKPDESAPSAQMDEVAAHNRAIVEFARQAGLPVNGTEMAGVSPPRPTPAFSSEISRLLSRHREGPARTVGHWFRYSSQGRAGWLVQTEFKGDVWIAEQLAILPAAKTDADGYITEVVKDKLAYLGGSVEGQAVAIETQRCGEVAVCFEHGLVDFRKPVTVRCNGTVRHAGPISPSIETLLETASEQWEFQRLTAAKLLLTVRSESEEED